MWEFRSRFLLSGAICDRAVLSHQRRFKALTFINANLYKVKWKYNLLITMGKMTSSQAVWMEAGRPPFLPAPPLSSLMHVLVSLVTHCPHKQVCDEPCVAPGQPLNMAKLYLKGWDGRQCLKGNFIPRWNYKKQNAGPTAEGVHQRASLMLCKKVIDSLGTLYVNVAALSSPG